jgi:hypothetical protein
MNQNEEKWNYPDGSTVETNPSFISQLVHLTQIKQKRKGAMCY